MVHEVCQIMFNPRRASMESLWTDWPRIAKVPMGGSADAFNREGASESASLFGSRARRRCSAAPSATPMDFIADVPFSIFWRDPIRRRMGSGGRASGR